MGRRIFCLMVGLCLIWGLEGLAKSLNQIPLELTPVLALKEAAGYIYLLEKQNSTYVVSKNRLTFGEDSSGR